MSAHRSVDALLFDLDGTLIDSRLDIIFSVQSLQRESGFPESSDDAITSFIGDGIGNLVKRAFGWPNEQALSSEESLRVDEGVERLKRIYREHCLDRTQLYPGVLETLKHFHAKKMAVVTNKPIRISTFIIEKLGLTPFFQTIVGGDSVLNKKPHPEPVEHALRFLGIHEKISAVMIGDSPVDVLSGRAAGTITCGIPSNIGNASDLQNAGPDFWVPSIAQLPDFFA